MLVYTWVRIPPLGCRPTADVQGAGFWAWSPQWAVDRVLPPSLALSGSLQVGAWINRHLQSAGVEKAMASFPFFSLLCPSSLLLPFGPHTSTPVLLHPRDFLLGHRFHHHLFALCSHLRLEVLTGPLAEGPAERRLGLGWTKCPRGHFPVRPSLCFLFVNFLSLVGSLSQWI